MSLSGGLLNINKPQGLTSFQVVQHVRRTILEKRVGHCGTLDPLASGVLLVLYGPATSLSAPLMGGEKVYRALIRLGIRTDTSDITGKVLEETAVPPLSEGNIRQALGRFIGESGQIPPMYSAIKFKGEKLYNLARKGIEVPRAPRIIQISEIALLSFSADEIEIRIRCSKGTYVRSLAEDLGKALGVPATLKALVRERSGAYGIADSIPWNDLVRMDRESLLSRSILAENG